MAERRYFFIGPQSEPPEIVVLDGDEFRHCVTVCRLREGEAVGLLDGRGRVFEAKIERIDSREARLRVVGVTEAPAPPPVDIALGMLKAPRLDFALEKCTELGLRRLILFTSERSVRRGERTAGARPDRIERKLIAACKQSGQPYLPEVEPVLSFEGLVAGLSPYSRVILADQGSTSTAANLPRESGAVIGIVGPEGSLSPGERDELLRHGAMPLSLGPFRLRSETAAVCLLYRLASDILKARAGV